MSGPGIAARASFLTYVATAAGVEVNDQSEVRILRVDTAVDAGTAVNPALAQAVVAYVANRVRVVSHLDSETAGDDCYRTVDSRNLVQPAAAWCFAPAIISWTAR